jgi:23S rRNA pseudouridine2605 synthase
MGKKKRRESDNPELTRPELADPENEAIEADAATADAATADAAIAAAASDTFEQAADGIVDRDNFVPSEPFVEQAQEIQQDEPESEPTPKLERLQKILAQAGIASRRHAEELMIQGRVQVNGTVVTELGSKADPARDHIRVDGKLLQGSERLRYFMLNKPKGFVTTVSDPEGRPTVMQFFSKMRERLYPVGRLDYISEGLLLVTNDGELANKLTRAASGVEKTYLVKVSGQPAEHDLDRLREGVAIDRGKPGSGRVPTAPAQIRRFHPGKGAGSRSGGQRGPENPWFEVVIIEGRNRELRKMFEEIGHHVEKIRRVGYGPLVLDVEPGKMRELEPEEIENLHKAAEGKYRKPKQRGAHMRSAAAETQSPTVKPHWTPKHGGEARKDRSPSYRPDKRSASGPSRSANRGMNRSSNRGLDRSRESGSQFRTEPRGAFRPSKRLGPGHSQRPPRPISPERPRDENRENRPRFAPLPFRDQGNRPTWKSKPGQGSRPPRFDRDTTERSGGARPNRFGSDRRQPADFRSAPRTRPAPQRFGGKPPSPPSDFKGRKRLDIRPTDEEFGTPQASPQERQNRTFQPRSAPRPASGGRPSNPRFAGRERAQSDRDRPRFDRDRPERPRSDRPQPGAGVRPQREDRPGRPPSGPRPGGFKRGGAGGRGGNTGPNRGGVRSSGGRRPGSRPGGKPGGGKRRP